MIYHTRGEQANQYMSKFNKKKFSICTKHNFSLMTVECMQYKRLKFLQQNGISNNLKNIPKILMKFYTRNEIFFNKYMYTEKTQNGGLYNTSV